jgi:acetyl esterase
VKDLHPVLKAALAVPTDPSAVTVDRQTPDEARAEFKRDMKTVDAPAPAVQRIEDREIPGPAGALRARIYDSRGDRSATLPLLVYFHGGGWIRGDIETHDSTCRVLAVETPCIIVSVDYRLAPEHRFPAAVEDAYAALRWVAANAERLGGDPRRIAVGGDSSGGNIAAAVTALARDRGGPAVAYQLLIYPVIDLGGETPSKRAFSKGYFLDYMHFYVASYLGPKGDPRDPLASPLLREDLTCLPPAFIVTAGYDPLRDEGEAYARRLAEAGVPVEHARFEDMIHGFISLRALVPDADDGLKQCAAALRKTLRL